MLHNNLFCYFPVSANFVKTLIHGHVPALARESSSVVLRALRREEGARAGAHGCCWLSPCVCSRRRRRGAQSYCRPANSLLCVLTAPGGGATSPRPSYWQPSDAISIPRAARRSPRGSFQRAAFVPSPVRDHAIPPGQRPLISGPGRLARVLGAPFDASLLRREQKSSPSGRPRGRNGSLGSSTIMTHYTQCSGARTPTTEIANKA